MENNTLDNLVPISQGKETIRTDLIGDDNEFELMLVLEDKGNNHNALSISKASVYIVHINTDGLETKKFRVDDDIELLTCRARVHLSNTHIDIRALSSEIIERKYIKNNS